MPAIFISSWDRQREELPCDFACSSMDSRRALLTELTLTTKATARLPNSGCISSSDNRSPSLIDSLRSSFSIRAWRLLRSRSADCCFGEKTSDDYLHPDIGVHRIAASRLYSVAGVSLAVGLRRAANAGR